MIEFAFWDSSSLVPLCVRRQAGGRVRKLIAKYQVVVWWSTPVEMSSAFARLLRMGELTAAEHAAARAGLHELRHSWRELQPTDRLREQAESLVDRFPLKAADALQLAAAMAWCFGRTTNRIFISGDIQLLDSARQLGFKAIDA